jgi:hypothetical protein
LVLPQLINFPRLVLLGASKKRAAILLTCQDILRCPEAKPGIGQLTLGGDQCKLWTDFHRSPLEAIRRSAMNEVVVAVYKSASAAEAAVEDLKVARVPSATIRQFVSDPAAQEGLLELHNRSIASGDRVVTVTVEDRHASAVMGILDMQVPVCMTEAQLPLE